MKVLKTTSGSSPRTDLSNIMAFSTSQSHATVPLSEINRKILVFLEQCLVICFVLDVSQLKYAVLTFNEKVSETKNCQLIKNDVVLLAVEILPK